jgi:hypothetical protein
VDRERFGRWIESYERAWRTTRTEPLGELFTEDAIYRTAPFERPFSGLDAIARFWDGEREGPDEDFEMTWDLVAVEGDTGVARIEVRYGARAHHYRNLWIVRLDPSGRCREFEEWPFWPPGSGGTFVPGPDSTDSTGQEG